MGARYPPSARGGDHAHPKGPRRYWDPRRQCFVEAHTLCRNSVGRWAKKTGHEPSAQLVLFPPTERGTAA